MMPELSQPQSDPFGRRISIDRPDEPTSPECWTDPTAAAIFVPCGAAPESLNGVAFKSWQWQASEDEAAFPGRADDPTFTRPRDLRASAGVVIVEPDDRIWLIWPSHESGTNRWSFPKGKVEAGDSLRGTAVKEAWEESGLHVAPGRFLIDISRPSSRTYARYFLARRIGGTPVDMGTESLAVMLAPRTEIPKLVQSPYDQPVVQAIERLGCGCQDLWKSRAR
jgi:8-oxo-dGTP pyrophosphatase MutT (NUDIX family)